MAAKQPAMSPSDLPVGEVLDRATGPRRVEVDELLAMFGEISGEQPVVWAGRIIGFGEFEYRYESGRRGRSPLLAFAPGPAHHTIYLAEHFSERWPDLMAELGDVLIDHDPVDLQPRHSTASSRTTRETTTWPPPSFSADYSSARYCRSNQPRCGCGGQPSAGSLQRYLS